MKKLFATGAAAAGAISSGAILLLILFALIIPISVVGGIGIVVGGTAVGIGAALNEGPVNCKAPPNLFDAWETLRDFVTGVDCTDICAVSEGGTTVATDSAEHVRTIIGVGKAMSIPEKGQIIAITTALVESSLKNYANDGVYNTTRNPADATLAEPTNILAFISKSIGFPHDAVGSDATSVGIFQQQAWWGSVGNSTWENNPDATITRLMDPTFQAQKFYDRMLTIANWEQMDYGVVAQQVQVSATPNAYTLRVTEAQDLYAQYSSEPTPVTLYDFGTSYEGDVQVGTTCGGTTGLVLDKTSLYQITAQWAQEPQEIRQGRAHGGMDIDCDSAYETVYAPVGGTVVIAVTGNQSGTGNPMGQVKIKSDDGTVFTFMHTRNAFVNAGDAVTGGSAIAECSSTGNSTGTHLHLEANVTNSTNADVKALPNAADKGLNAGLRDPALVLELLGVDICPPYTANRKTVGVGNPLPTTYMKCWASEEWVR